MATFTGTDGDDSFDGSKADDVFHLEQGGEDTARGGAGDDVFFLGQSFDAGDRINGGRGHDVLVLDGSYDLTFQANTLTNVEQITLTAGWHYWLDGLTDANINGSFTLDASELALEDAVYFDASQVANHGVTLIGGGGFDTLIGGDLGDSLVGGFGPDSVRGGMGDDTIDGGAGPDTLGGGQGNDQIRFGPSTYSVDGGAGDDVLTATSDFWVHSQIDGGDGEDLLVALGATHKIVLTGKNLVDVERVIADGRVIAKDSLVADGGTLTVSASSQALNFDGSAEASGRFILTGFQGDDTLIGGGGDDRIKGNRGADSLVGGAGNDKLDGGLVEGGDTLLGGDGNDHLHSSGSAHGSLLDGGAGDDRLSAEFAGDTMIGGLGQDTMSGAIGHSDLFQFVSVQDSALGAADLIQNLEDGDVIDLSAIDADLNAAGDQAFHLATSFSGQAGELVLSYDATGAVTSIAGDVDGDGAADLVITASGDHRDFANFVL